jgi:hypothetical protein
VCVFQQGELEQGRVIDWGHVMETLNKVRSVRLIDVCVRTQMQVVVVFACVSNSVVCCICMYVLLGGHLACCVTCWVQPRELEQGWVPESCGGDTQQGAAELICALNHMQVVGVLCMCEQQCGVLHEACMCC